MRVLTEGDANSATTFTVTVTVLDRNDAPVFVAQSRDVDENAVEGTLIGLPLVATDPDGDDIVWSIELGNANSAFLISSSGQLSAGSTIPSPLDFESTPTWRIVVRAANVEDQDGVDTVVAYTDATVTVTLNDLNEPPTAGNLTVQLKESFGQNSEVGSARDVGTLPVTEQDAGQTLSVQAGVGYSVQDFTISSDGTVNMKDGSKLDYETSPVVLVPYIATDDYSPPATARGFVVIEV